MHVWDYDITTLKQGEEAELWKLQRQVLYGLKRGEKLSEKILRRLRPRLLGIPTDRLRFLDLLLAS